MMPALRPAMAKLPLTTRKNLRDIWEAKKPEYEASISKALGEAWTLDLQPALIGAYCNEDYLSRMGSVITWYMDPLVANIERYISNFGEDGKEEMNSVCSKHQIYFGPQTDTKYTYGGLVVSDGVLNLVFQEENLGSNTSDVSREIAKALQEAPAPAGGAKAYNILARNAVREKYDPEIENVRAAIGAQVGMPDIKLNGNFDDNAAMLIKSGEKDWERNFGYFTLSYFSGLKYQLERNKFSGDDMLQEAFQEGVGKGEICVRIVPKLTTGQSSYGEVTLEDGVLYLQAPPNYWGTNIDDCAVKLMDLF